VSAPQFFVDPAAWGSPQVGRVMALHGPEARHAVVSVRIGPGEVVWLADGVGRRCRVRVVSAAPDALVGEVEVVESVPAAEPTYTLVQALAKGDRDELAVEMATELGVDRVVPWQAQRSIVQWRGDRGERSRRKWESVVLAAAKQSRRAWVPVVEPAVTGAEVVGRVSRSALVLVLHEEARQPLAAVTLPATGEVALVVGPEGGVTPAELEAFSGVGAVAVRLGPEVLRTSTAGPAVLAVLSSRTRW
jgi:16S rRNA (uracil1498-N3)-methyltransferase